MSTGSTTPLRWLVPVLIVVVSLTVGGGLLARELYQEADLSSSITVAGIRPQSPVTASLPPQQQPGSPTVELTRDAAAHPDAGTVRDLLQANFDAINAGDYDAWASTVVAERIAAQPRDVWLRDYQSTKDGSILVYRMQQTADQRLTVLIGLTSTQDVEDAPPDTPSGCIRWHLTYRLVESSGEWKIDTLPEGTTAEYEAC